MNSEWNPASLLINRRVSQGLKQAREVWDERYSGKTETLLAYIALLHSDAIIVTSIVAFDRYLRNMWKTRYPKLPEPRFLSLRQFEQMDGISGIVFTDECKLSQKALDRFNPMLTFGGGVYS